VLPSLTHLDLSSNKIVTVPDLNFPGLTTLLLHQRQLAVVPNFNLPNLMKLRLHQNQLATVPVNGVGFQSVRTIAKLQLTKRYKLIFAPKSAHYGTKL